MGHMWPLLHVKLLLSIEVSNTADSDDWACRDHGFLSNTWFSQ